MYFEIDGSKVRLAGTMHRVPQGRPLAPWAHEAISAAQLIYIEHVEDVRQQGQFAPPLSLPLAQRLPRSWSRIERQCRRDLVVQMKPLRPRAVASYLLDTVSLDPGVEHLALAKSRATHPLKPRIEYLETRDQYLALEDGVSDAVWDEAVSWTLDNRSSSKTLLESSYDAWIAGDFEAIDRISSTDSLNRFEDIKEANINARNRLWLPTICELAQSANEPTLILVGVAHLGGANGLLPLLAGRGLKLTVGSSR
jgi:uncharacterized protein